MNALLLRHWSGRRLDDVDWQLSPCRSRDVVGDQRGPGLEHAYRPAGYVRCHDHIAELVKGLLVMPDLGDRLGFSGPSVRGAAPEVAELGREASTLAQRLSAKYP